MYMYMHMYMYMYMYMYIYMHMYRHKPEGGHSQESTALRATVNLRLNVSDAVHFPGVSKYV